MKNKLLKKLMLSVALLCGSFIYAQSVSGTVSDTSGPLPGVNVLIKGTSTGTVTDFDGNFQINANNGDTIVFSFIGYLTQEVVVSGSTMTITLTEDAAQLDEVVVVGYGSTTKKEITSAVTKVGEEEFNRGTINAPEQLLTR
jgi:hypothetical protein